MRIDLTCKVCGQNRFSLEHDVEDDSHIKCEDCGHEIGTLAELKQQVAEEVIRRSKRERPETSA